MTSFSSDQGKKRRTVEIHCEEVLPVGLAEKTHEFVTEHYGLIGREWIEIIKENINEIKSIYRYLKKEYRTKRPDAVLDHVNFIAAAYTAEIIFDVYLRNLNFENVWEELHSNNYHIYDILVGLPMEQGTSSAERAKTFIKEFIASRWKHFVNERDLMAIDPVYGIIKSDYIALYPYRLKGELKKAGFSPEKIINELLDENFFVRDEYGNKTHLINIRQNNINLEVNMYKMPLK